MIDHLDFPISKDSIFIPTPLLQKLKIFNATFFALLLEKETITKIKEKLNDDESFSLTEKEVEAYLITPYRQSKAIKLFLNLKILDYVKIKGHPPKRYFKINHKELNSFIKEHEKNNGEE